MKYFTFALLCFAGAVSSVYLKTKGLTIGLYLLGYIVGMTASYISDHY